MIGLTDSRQRAMQCASFFTIIESQTVFLRIEILLRPGGLIAKSAAPLANACLAHLKIGSESPAVSLGNLPLRGEAPYAGKLCSSGNWRQGIRNERFLVSTNADMCYRNRFS